MSYGALWVSGRLENPVLNYFLKIYKALYESGAGRHGPATTVEIPCAHELHAGAMGNVAIARWRAAKPELNRVHSG